MNKELYNDLLYCSDEKIEEKYGFDKEHSKIAKNIAENINCEKKEKDIKGKKVRGCASNGSITTTFCISSNKLYDKNGSVLQLYYDINSNYKSTQSYNDVAAIAWNGKLEVDAVIYRSTYKKIGNYYGVSKAEYNSMPDLTTYWGDTQRNDECGILLPKESVTSNKNYLTADAAIDNITNSRMICWVGKQVFYKQFKDYAFTGIGHSLTYGAIGCYVHPSSEKSSTEKKCSVKSEYIHKTKYGDMYSNGKIGVSKYEIDYFDCKESSKKAIVVKSGISTAIGLVNAPAGVALTAADVIYSNFIIEELCSSKNYQGPACAEERTYDYYRYYK